MATTKIHLSEDDAAFRRSTTVIELDVIPTICGKFRPKPLVFGVDLFKASDYTPEQLEQFCQPCIAPEGK